MEPSSPQEGYIPVPGGRAWYRVAASDREIPLLMIQGGPGTSPGYFEPLVALSEERPVVLYDSLEDASVGEWGRSFSVDRFREIRAALGLVKVHVLGYGFGAVAALEYALSQPEGLASLILDPVDPAAFIRHVCEALRARSALPSYMCTRPDPRLERLSEIKVPTLLIWEELGAAVEVSRCEGRLLPGWEMTVLPSNARGTFEGAQDVFTGAVRRFLARVESGPAGVDALSVH